MRIVAPLAAAVVTVTAALVASGQQLIILHLVGLLLVVAVGSNYALFFDHSDPGTAISPRTLASMLFANLTTVAGFGVLAFSNVSLLQAMGVTVAPGVDPGVDLFGDLRQALPCLIRRWHSTPLLRASIALHLLALAAVVAAPGLWPWALAAVVADHLLIVAVGLWPRSRWLGAELDSSAGRCGGAE